MADVEKNIIELAVSVIGMALFALVGFVWKISHRVTKLESEQKLHRKSAERDGERLRKDVDYLISKVDRADDRIHSIVRKRGD